MSDARIVIAGGPRVGKTSLAAKLGEGLGDRLMHTDDIMAIGWSEASEAVSHWFDIEAPWLVEGVAAGRALRKWLAAYPEGAPCDVVYWSETPREPLTKGQAAMLKGCVTVWAEVRDELVARGVRIEEF